MKFSKHATISAAQSFGLVEMKKGYISHLYNTEENNILESKKHLTRLPDPSLLKALNV